MSNGKIVDKVLFQKLEKLFSGFDETKKGKEVILKSEDKHDLHLIPYVLKDNKMIVCLTHWINRGNGDEFQDPAFEIHLDFEKRKANGLGFEAIFTKLSQQEEGKVILHTANDFLNSWLSILEKKGYQKGGFKSL